MKPMVQKYRHIIWDWNGTLLDLMLSIDIVNSMLTRCGLATLSLERYREVFSVPVKDYYETIGFDFRRESFEETSACCVSTYKARRHETSLYPQAQIILEQFRDAGQCQSILSAHDQETLAELVETFGVTHFFQRLAGLEDGHATSKIRRGRELLTSIPHRPSEVLLIGDTLHDAEVAKAIEVDCI